MKIIEYRIGVELLDKDKKPIEHIEYEVEKDFETALNVYNNFVIDENSAKYLFGFLENEDYVEILSSGYKSQKELV